MNTTLSTAAASNSASLAAVVLIVWVLSLFKITVPADVATAIGVLLAAGIHYLIAIKVLPGLPDDTADKAPK